jgi:replicative DNA helicase
LMSKLRKHMENNRKVGILPNTYLNERLRGILLGDLILIGTRPGAGKSTLANSVAIINRDRGQKVSLFSLENFEGDCLIEKAYYKYMELTGDYSLSQRDFASGSFQQDMIAFDEAERYAQSCFEGINIVNRRRGYSIEELKNDIIKAAEEHDSKLIIIDHLDYVAKEGNESDNQHISDLMRTIREVQDAFKVAVVAISHLRKPQTIKDAPIVPSMDEFIGSGNKVKEATVVITLAPDDDRNMNLLDKTKRYTWCCIRKLRMGGIDNQVAHLVFDTKTGEYLNKHELFKVNYSGTKIDPIK